MKANQRHVRVEVDAHLSLHDDLQTRSRYQAKACMKRTLYPTHSFEAAVA